MRHHVLPRGVENYHHHAAKRARSSSEDNSERSRCRSRQCRCCLSRLGGILEQCDSSAGHDQHQRAARTLVRRATVSTSYARPSCESSLYCDDRLAFANACPVVYIGADAAGAPGGQAGQSSLGHDACWCQVVQ